MAPIVADGGGGPARRESRAAACSTGEDGRVPAQDAATPSPRRRGRRPGGADTRGALLAAARAEFAERGFDAATVRVIADRAGVDPAMVNHWFGGKEALFAAALELPVDPATLVAELAPGDPGRLGERIVTRFLTVWDHTGGGPLSALVRNVAGHEIAARLMRQLISRVLVHRIVAPVAPDRPDLRAALCATQLIGLGIVRYVLRLEPLASADHPTVVAAVAPTLQRYLTGPLDRTDS
jgi:AcrR family transcriptional regulator